MSSLINNVWHNTGTAANYEDDSGNATVEIESNTADAICILKAKTNQTSDTALFNIQGYNEAAADIIATIRIDRVSNDDEGQITLYTQPNGGALTKRVTIHSDGYLQVHTGLKSSDGTAGATGSGNNVTVKNGIVTAVS